MNQNVILKIYHIMDLNELQNRRIIYKINLGKSEKCRICRKMNLSRSQKWKCIKNYKNMSKEELLIILLKSEINPAELYKSKSNDVEIEET